MTVTVSMSALWLKLTTLLCLFFTALSAPDSHGVLLNSITVHCSCAEGQDLTVMKGHVPVLVKNTLEDGFKDRLRVEGTFPNIKLVIKNLTPEDIGPYSCLCEKVQQAPKKSIKTNGTVSVLLSMQDRSINDLILVSVMISVGVILSIIMGVLIWLIKTKTGNLTKRPGRVLNNGVYEEMRGTPTYQSVHPRTNRPLNP